MCICKVISGGTNVRKLSDGEKDLLRDVFAKKYGYDEERLVLTLSLMNDNSISVVSHNIKLFIKHLNRTEQKIIAAKYGIGAPRVEKESMIPEQIGITQGMFKTNKVTAMRTLKKVREWQNVEDIFSALRYEYLKKMSQQED